MSSARARRTAVGAGGLPEVRRWVPVLGLILVTAVFAGRALVHLDHWGIQDWDSSVFYTACARESVVVYGQAPLWNPWLCGGTPLLARPECLALSPAFLVVLLLGAYTGMRVLAAIYLAVGLAGAYRLGRHMGLMRIPAMVTALVYLCSGPFTAHLVVGNTWVLPMGLIPWTFFFVLRAYDARGDWRGGAGDAAVAGLLLAGIWLGGAPYLLVMTGAGLLIHALGLVLRRRVPLGRAGAVLGVAAAVAGLLSAAQLIPCLEYVRQFPRDAGFHTGFSLQSLAMGLWAPDQRLHAVDALQRVGGLWHGVSQGMNETSTYLGYVPTALVAIGLVAWGRRHAEWIVLLCVCVWLSLGVRAAPVSLWDWMRELPGLGVMRVAERFRLIFLLPLALFAGQGLECVLAMVRRKAGASAGASLVAGGAVAGLAVLEYALVVAPLMDQAFTLRPIRMEPAPGRAFVQTEKHYFMASGRWAREGDDPLRCAWSSHMPALAANQGIVDGKDEIPVPRTAVPQGNPGYRGEVFVFGTEGEARYVRWTPNVLRMALRTAGAGYLVVNQNFLPGWHVRGGGGRVVEKVGGLLAVKVGPDDREIEIYYRPVSVLVGAGVSALSAVALVVWWWRSRRRQRLLAG